MSNRWLYAWALGSVAFGGVSLLVPLYVVALGGTPFTLGVLAAAAAFVGVPGALIFGRLADKTGKRRIFVLLALALLSAMLVVIPAIRSIPVVIAANAVIWFVFAAATPIVTLLAVAGVDESRWSTQIALLNKYQGIGWAVGLLLGVLWTAGTARIFEPIAAQQGFFVICALCAVGGFFAATRQLPADPRPDEVPSPATLRRAIRNASRFNVRGVTFPFTLPRTDPRGLDPRRLADRFTPTLAVYFVAVVLAFAGAAAFFAPLPAFLADSGYDSDGIFVLYLLSSVASAVFFGRAGTFAANHDVQLVQIAGFLARAAALPVIAIVGLSLGVSAGGLVGSSILFVVLGVSWAVIVVTAGTIVTQLAPVTVRGEALGVYSALGAFAGGLGSILGGWLASSSYLIAFGVAGGLVAAGAGVVALLWHQRAAVGEPERSTVS